MRLQRTGRLGSRTHESASRSRWGTAQLRRWPAEVRPRLAEIELFEPDVNKIADVARRPIRAASLSSVTEGDLDRSLRHRELCRPSGFGDELRVALTDGSVTWGALTLMRERARPAFTDADVRFVASLSSALAEAVRATTVPDPASMTEREDETGCWSCPTTTPCSPTTPLADGWRNWAATSTEVFLSPCAPLPPRPATSATVRTPLASRGHARRHVPGASRWCEGRCSASAAAERLGL